MHADILRHASCVDVCVVRAAYFQRACMLLCVQHTTNARKHALTHFRAHPSTRVPRLPSFSARVGEGNMRLQSVYRLAQELGALSEGVCALDEHLTGLCMSRDRQTDRQTDTHPPTHTHTPPRPLHHEHVLLYNYICQAVVQSHFDALLQQNDGLFQRKKMQKLLKTKASCKYGTYFSLKWS